MDKKIGKLSRIDLDQDTGEMHLVIEVIDAVFKNEVLHSSEYDSVLYISGKDVMQILSTNK